MSETALSLIKSSLRVLGVIAVGETPTDDEVQDGLEALKYMLRHWSAKNIRLYYTDEDSLVLTGAASYTVGSAGTFNITRPMTIRSAYVRSSSNVDMPLNIMDEQWYRNLSMKDLTGTPEYLWYIPEYPLGKLYLWPIGTGTLFIHSLKPLVEPTVITSTMAFPQEYDEAIKYNLALRMAPEYGKQVDPVIAGLALDGLNDIETKNFVSQINAARPEVIKMVNRFNIDEI